MSKSFRVLVSLIAVAAAFAAPGLHAASARGAATGLITVMTRNLDPGFSEVGVLSAPDLESLLAAVADAWTQIQANDFPSRSAAIASEIVATQPDLVGIQEAPVFRVFHPDGTIETLDYLEILAGALRRRGLGYRVVAVQSDIDVTLPSATGDYIEYTDRDAILARPGIPVVKTASANYEAGFEVPVAGGIEYLPILRGWVAADVETGGRTIRFVTSHMEDLDLDVQAAEAAELLAGPAGAPETILVGDINSDADAEGATYEAFLADGFADAWSDLRPSDPGFTWGFDPLTDPDATLSQRLDVVLYRGDFDPESISLVGDQPAGRTPSGLWPSDHAGVVATLTVPAR